MQIISNICAYIERSKKHPLENVVQQEHLKADFFNGCFENGIRSFRPMVMTFV